MQLHSALLFEPLEEIFARVWRHAAPHAEVPAVTLSFHRYANANSRIQLNRGRAEVRVSDVLAGAPAPVFEALAWILISKLYRRTPPSDYQKQYRLWLNRHDVRRSLQVVRQARGRKFISGPQGAHFDLQKMFDALNLSYFQGSMPAPQLGWSRRPSRTLLGHFDPSHNAIILSSLLDRAGVPPLCVEYVLFHEMLHLRYPVEHRGSRRCVHTPAFKAAEKQFGGLAEAKALLKLL